MREGIYILRLSGRLVLHLSTYIHRSLYSQVLNTHQATLLFFTLLRPSQTPSASQQPTPPSPPYHVLHPPDRTGHHTGRRLPRNAAPADRARRARRPGGTAPCPRLHPRHRARRTAACAPQHAAPADRPARRDGAAAGIGAEESSGSSDEAEDAGAAYVGQSGGPDGQHAPQWGPGPSNPPDNWLSR